MNNRYLSGNNRHVLEHNRQIFGELGNSIIGKIKSIMYQCLETVQMKVSTSYGPVKVQSQTATQEPVYELADTIQPREDVRTV